jgi:hypothetical protein
MSTPRKPSPQIGDVETSYPTVVDAFGKNEGQPLTVRLGDLWSDFVRASEQSRGSDGYVKAAPAVPFLDDMKGILEWD